MFFYPKEDTLNISRRYLYWKCVRKGGVKKGGTWRTLGGFLTGDMEDRVIPDVMNHVSPKLLPLEVCQEGGYLEDVGGFLTGDIEDRVIPDVMNNDLLPKGRYPENFVLISQWEVYSV